MNVVKLGRQSGLKNGGVVVLKIQRREKHRTRLSVSSPEFLFNYMQIFLLLKVTTFSRVAYAADCGSRGFCMIIFGQYTKIIGESIRKQKNHVANFYDGFPVFWAIF